MTDRAKEAPVVRGSRIGEGPVTSRLLTVAARPAAKTSLAVIWLVAAAMAYLAPALLHGTKLGAQDILEVFGLGAIPGTQPHNAVASDQIQEMMPWAALSWVEVHHGHFPLWNPYSGFGMPLFLNFVSASMSLPMLVSYLAPERFVYTIEVVVKLLIAGTGVLWMCRRLGLRHLPSTLAATAFMLSGSLTGWLGWPMSGTMGWLGWAVGAAVLIVRSDRHRILHVAGLAVVLAFVVYAGHPETLVIVIMCTAMVAAGALVDLGIHSGNVRSILRPLAALGAAGFAAVGLAAPLLLPGLQIVGRAARADVTGYPLPPKSSINLLFASYDGLPIRGSQYFGAAGYYESAAYVGVVVLVLAALALLLRRRDHMVISLVAAGLVCVALTYSAPVSRLLDRIPAVKNLQWTRSLTALDFVLCVLAGFGLQVLLDRGRKRPTRAVFAALVAFAALLLGALWLRNATSNMTPVDVHIRSNSFLWPAVDILLLFIAALVLLLPDPPAEAVPRWRTWRPRLAAAGSILFAGEAAFLLTATPHIWSSSHLFFPVTAAEKTLQADVGQARVGFASCPSIIGMPNLGILTEANDVYRVSEASAYDGTVPKSYFTAYYQEIHQPVPADTGFGQFCPSMINASIARHFGVSFVLSQSGAPAPPGMLHAATIDGEDLYSVPGSALMTVQPTGTMADSATAEVVPNTSTDPAELRAVIRPIAASTIYLHVTDFPGWKATIDNHPLSLRPWGGTMLAASVPPGLHVIVVRYEPSAFKIGLILALLTAVVLVALSGWCLRRQRGSLTYSSERTTGSGNTV